MLKTQLITVAILIGFLAPTVIETAKILAIFGFPELAQYGMAEGLLNGLNERGHDILVVISSQPEELTLNENIQTITIEENKHLFDDIFFSFTMDNLTTSFYDILQTALGHGATMCSNVMENSEFKQVLNTQTFDLVLIEIFMSESLSGLGELLQAPLVGVTSLGDDSMLDILMGNVSPASIVPQTLMLPSFDMSFRHRCLNVALNLIDGIIYHVFYLPQQHQLYTKLFPAAALTFEEAYKNVSLVLSNQHFTLYYPRPLIPNIIEVAGLHIPEKLEPLPWSIHHFLQAAKQDVIYINPEKRHFRNQPNDNLLLIFQKVFEELNFKIIWHTKEPLMTRAISSNILMVSNISHSLILAQAQVKLFITNGDLRSLTETVYFGKPMLGIPIDASDNIFIDFATNNGYALSLKPKQLNVENLKFYILEILNNPRYKERAQQLSKLFRDQPMKPLDTAIYWLEYVLRHKGAAHLASKSRFLKSWQFYNLDVYAVFIMGFIAIVLMVFCILKLWLNLVRIIKNEILEKKIKAKRN